MHDPRDPRALQVRAYARGMADLASLALEDLAAARQLPPGTNLSDSAPIIDAWCRYDLPAMRQLAAKPGEYQSLAQMLVVAIACDGFSTATQTQAAIACLGQQPNNLWVM